MSEMKMRDVSEIKQPEAQGFREIKPESKMSPDEARSFLHKELGTGFYTDYKDRIDRTPAKDSELGKWEGERGESKFIPSDDTDKGRRGIAKLAEYGLNGIEYRNGEPDYSECNEGTVKINNMTECRPSNFDQADAKLAEQWNAMAKEGRTDWTMDDVESFRKENRLSWHECCDTETMQLVSQDIHGGDTSVFLHSGGVAECKARDNCGGGFDD